MKPPGWLRPVARVQGCRTSLARDRLNGWAAASLLHMQLNLSGCWGVAQARPKGQARLTPSPYRSLSPIGQDPGHGKPRGGGQEVYSIQGGIYLMASSPREFCGHAPPSITSSSSGQTAPPRTCVTTPLAQVELRSDIGPWIVYRRHAIPPNPPSALCRNPLTMHPLRSGTANSSSSTPSCGSAFPTSTARCPRRRWQAT